MCFQRVGHSTSWEADWSTVMDEGWLWSAMAHWPIDAGWSRTADRLGIRHWKQDDHDQVWSIMSNPNHNSNANPNPNSNPNFNSNPSMVNYDQAWSTMIHVYHGQSNYSIGWLIERCSAVHRSGLLCVFNDQSQTKSYWYTFYKAQ